MSAFTSLKDSKPPPKKKTKKKTQHIVQVVLMTVKKQMEDLVLTAMSLLQKSYELNSFQAEFMIIHLDKKKTEN